MTVVIGDTLDSDDSLEGVDPSFEVEREQARRGRRAKAFLQEHNVEDIGIVYHVWLEPESDWPGDTVLYRTISGDPMTAVVRGEGEDAIVTTIKGWDSP